MHHPPKSPKWDWMQYVWGSFLVVYSVSDRPEKGGPHTNQENDRFSSVIFSRQPENILITNGAAQSFNLLCCLIYPNEYALVENPLSYGILHTLEHNHVRMKPIELDEHGLRTSELPDTPPKLIFTTPSHQFPTGVVFPAARRIELLEYAQRHDAYIVEDDYDSEFRFEGNPIQSMQCLDPDRVIYVGTFSKTLMPALRIGYMVLLKTLCAQMWEEKYVADLHSPIVEQRTLARFIETGMFERHIRNMRKLYLRKRNFLVHCLEDRFGEHVRISGTQAGLHFVAAFQGVRFNEELLRKIEDEGVEIAPVRNHYLSQETTTPYDDALVFGYGNTRIDDIEKGIGLLASLMLTR